MLVRYSDIVLLSPIAIAISEYRTSIGSGHLWKQVRNCLDIQYMRKSFFILYTTFLPTVLCCNVDCGARCMKTKCFWPPEMGMDILYISGWVNERRKVLIQWRNNLSDQVILFHNTLTTNLTLHAVCFQI